MKINKIVNFLIIIGMIIMTSNVVIASTPSYDFEDHMNDTVINGDNEIGKIVFLKSEYLPTEHNISKISNYEFQRFDLITLRNESNLRIIPPFGEEILLSNGESFRLDYSGDYIIQSLTNLSKNAIIKSLQEDESKIEIDVRNYNGFNLSFEKSYFVLDDEEVMDATIFVDDDVDAGKYEIEYDINNNGIEETKIYHFNVTENIDWEISNMSMDVLQIKNGESSYFGYVEIENKGNKEVEINVSKNGEGSHLMTIPQSQTLYKKSRVTLNFQVQVPILQEPKTYDVSLNISGGDKNIILPIEINVTDSVKPVIENITFAKDTVYTDNLIKVVATDNNNVSNVTVKHHNKTYQMSKDGNVFRLKTNFTLLSKYIFDFCAYDNSDNFVCEQVNKTFIKENIINEFNSSVKLPSKKVGIYSKIELFNITKETEEGIYINMIQLNDNIIDENISKPIVRIVLEDGTTKSFSNFDNQIHVDEIGMVSLEFRSDDIVDYDGIIRIEVPDYVQEVEDIYFSVSFKEYDIPEDFEMSWFDQRMLECNVIDTGDMDTTMYKCFLEFPIDVKKEDLSFPTTIREKQQLDDDVSEVEDEMRKLRNRSATINTLLLMLTIFVGFGAYFMLYMYPYIRLKSKLKKFKGR